MSSGDSTLSHAVPYGDHSGIRLAQPSALLVGVVSRFGGRNRLNEPDYKLFWQTVAIAASMLIFASLRPWTTEVTAGDTTRSILLNSSTKGLRQTLSGPRSQQTEVSKAAEVQLRQSNYFVAKDFTNHFSLHAHGVATKQKSELTRNAQGSVSQKRVVFN